jgi:hypothetical protein
MIDMKAVLHAMLSGWCLEQNMTDEEKDGMEPHSHYLPYCDNDRNVAECLALFSYWGNDIVSMASEFGITTELVDGKMKVVDTPPRPSADHWFDTGGYKWDPEKEEHVWEAGAWREKLEEMPEGEYEVEVTSVRVE